MSSNREFDILVFGASGFTGQYVVKYLKDLNTEHTVAIAGRSKTKLEAVNQQFGCSYPVILADVKNSESLKSAVSQARVVLNCVGPFRFLGEPVVEACVESSTHYLDICGEPEFIERMEAFYNSKATEKNALIVSACGFDSIPADMGTVFTVNQLPEGAIPHSIDSFISIQSGPAGFVGHFATYESAVHGFGSADSLRKLRRDRGRLEFTIPGKKPSKNNNPHYEPRVEGYSIPFPGADASIVKRSQYYLANREIDPAKPVHYNAYMTIPSFLWTSVFVVSGTIFQTLASFSYGRSLLLKFPKLFTFGTFSHEGPSEEQMQSTAFKMTLFCNAYSSQEKADSKDEPDLSIKCSVSGPEPGYVATPIFLVQCALTVLEEEDTLPRGVLTPAGAFSKSQLIDRLNSTSVTFQQF